MMKLEGKRCSEKIKEKRKLKTNEEDGNMKRK